MKEGDPFGSPSWKSYEDRLTRHQNPTKFLVSHNAVINIGDYLFYF